MSTLQERLKAAQNLVYKANMLLENLELGKDESDELQGEISSVCNSLARTLEQLKAEAEQEPSSKREVLKRKVRALSDEHQVMQSGLDKYITGAHRRRTAALNRRNLLSGVQNKDSSAQDMLVNESHSIGKSNQNVHNLVVEGSAVLDALNRQSNTLKSTEGKLLSYVQSLDVSGSVLTAIHRVERTDRLIVYSGMIVITFLIFLIWWFR